MPAYTTKDIRNIALVGHARAGKTCLTESLLYTAGVIKTKGSIEKGSTVTDHDPLEKEHQHSLIASLVSFDHNQSHINLIDTPGYPDFLGPTLSGLAAVETVAIVVNAHNGIETNTRKMFDWATEHNFCRMFIINHIDAEDTDLESLYADLQEQFGSECLALNLPANGGAEVVDCFFNPSGEADFSSVEDAHTALIDQTVEVDEELMTLYLDQGEISPEQLHDPFEQAMREGHLIPVCFASAQTGAGVKQLIEVMDRLMPNPLEANALSFVNGVGGDAESVDIFPDPSLPVVAHVFKISFDPFVGKISVFRVHQGTINKDSQLFVGDARKAIKIGHLFSLQGKEHVDVQQGIPGDIRAISKVDGIELNSVLHDSHDEDLIHLKPFQLPKPMVGLAIEPKSRGDEQKVSEGLHRLIEEDPCIKLERNSSANETVLRGLGDLHLRIALERMQRQYNVEIATHIPSIPYRETITKTAEGHCRHKKQTGGAGQFGEVFLRVEPLPRGEGFEFVNKIVGGAIPSQFIPAVEKGVQQVAETGAFAGYPMEDIRVIVYDGKFHSVDSKEIAFVAAGKKAFVDAVNKARPIILEPIVEVEVSSPNSRMGDITGDLSSRRGRVSSTDSLKGGNVSIVSYVPLSEMEDYQSRLKSITAGEGSYSVQLSSYEPAPPDQQKKLQAGFSHAEED